MTITSHAITENDSSRYAQVHDCEVSYRIHYNDCGHGEEIVVLLHGSGPDGTGWANFNRNVEPLVAAGYRVVLMDCQAVRSRHGTRRLRHNPPAG